MRIRKERLNIPHLHRSLEGYRILHVSDIHFDESIASNSDLWEALRSGDLANIILITGDFITYDRYTNSLVEQLAGATAKDGVFGVLGNHDYMVSNIAQHFYHDILRRSRVSNNWHSLVYLLKNIGVRVLINEYVSVRTEAGVLIFIEGTDDPVIGNPEIAEREAEYDSSSFKVLMSHSPDILYSAELRKKKYDLILSGHTHGGQIRLPGIGPLFTATKYAKRNECSGTYKITDGTFVNVSSGVGHSLLPIRFNCPAELVVLELKG